MRNFKCCICGKEVTEYGCNPEPVKKMQSGLKLNLCCEQCHWKHVIPLRYGKKETETVTGLRFIFDDYMVQTATALITAMHCISIGDLHRVRKRFAKEGLTEVFNAASDLANSWPQTDQQPT